MLYSQFYLKDNISRLKTLHTQLKEGSDVEQFKTKIYGICFELAMAAEENYFTLGSNFYREVKGVTVRAMGSISKEEDPLRIKEIIENILDLFDEDRDYESIGTGSFLHGPNMAATRYEPMDEFNLREISKSINVPDRKLNILDPCCRDGINLGAIKAEISNCDAYGIELDSSMANRAKENIDRVAKGSFVGSRISNEVFDVMLLRPPVSWAKGSGYLSTLSKQETTYFRDTLKYVRPGGLIMFIIPYFRLYKDICIQLSKHLEQVQVRKLCGRDFSDKGLIITSGKRSSSRVVDQDTYKLLRRLYDPSSLSDVYDLPFEKYDIPAPTLNIELFRGSVLDTEDMRDIVGSSGCMDAFWQSQKVEKISENTKQPLLPFNIGQIGLVLTSGCLDGVIDEGNGHCHIIKGRVSKKSDVERDVDGDSLEIQETISNRVEINVLLPNGEYKVLA